MMITQMLVSIRPAKPSANVFWIAMMIQAAKLRVCLPSKVNIPSALARFVKLIKKFLTLFHRKNAHSGAHVTTMTVTCQKRKRF